MNKLTKKTTVREILQQVGTEFGRSFSPNIWVNALMNDYVSVKVKDTLLNKKTKKASDKLWKIGHLRESNWIITDMRFPNELKAVKDRGGITIRVNTTRAVEISNHESETALDDAKFDHVIDNSGTIEELIQEVRRILIEEKIIES